MLTHSSRNTPHSNKCHNTAMYIQVMSLEQLQQHQLSMHSLFWHCYFQSHPIHDPDLMIEALIQILPHASNFQDSATSFLSQLYLGMTICCLAFVTRCPEHSSDQSLVRKSLPLLAIGFNCSVFSFEQKVVFLYPFAARLVISADDLSFLLHTNTDLTAFSGTTMSSDPSALWSEQSSSPASSSSSAAHCNHPAEHNDQLDDELEDLCSAMADFVLNSR